MSSRQDVEDLLAKCMNDAMCEMIDNDMEMDTCKVTAHVLAKPAFQKLIDLVSSGYNGALPS